MRSSLQPHCVLSEVHDFVHGSLSGCMVGYEPATSQIDRSGSQFTILRAIHARSSISESST